MYSCHTTPESSPPFMLRKSSASAAPESSNRYICIVGDWPSGGVPMFALFLWLTSGPPSPSVSAPSSVCVSTGSSPPVPPTSKLPDVVREGDVVTGEVVVEAGDEVEGLDGVLVAVGLPTTSADRRVPRARLRRRGSSAPGVKGVNG